MLISLRIEPLSLHPCSKKPPTVFGGWWTDKASAVGGTKMLIDKNSLLSYYNCVYTKRFSKKKIFSVRIHRITSKNNTARFSRQ